MRYNLNRINTALTNFMMMYGGCRLYYNSCYKLWKYSQINNLIKCFSEEFHYAMLGHVDVNIIAFTLNLSQWIKLLKLFNIYNLIIHI